MDPGRARQNSLATAGTNFTKPGGQNEVDPCRMIKSYARTLFGPVIVTRHKIHDVALGRHHAPQYTAQGWYHEIYDSSSGQPKQTKTETSQNQNKCLRKAKAGAKTFILAETHCFGQTNVWASQFILCPSFFLFKLTENSTNTTGTC